MVKNFRLQGVNDKESIETVDPLSFSFHGAKKALMYQCIKLMHPIPLEVLEKLHSPLAKAQVRIYKKYLENERQEWRKEIYERVIPFMILLTAEEGDPNHAEVATWWIYELWKELGSGQVDIPLDPLMPSNWWSDEREGRNWIAVTFNEKRTTNTILPEMEVL